MLMDGTASSLGLDSQQAYFEVMMDVLADKKDIKFVEINTNSQAGSAAALRDHHPVAPLVAAALPQSGAAAFARMDVKIPFMAIIDKEGQVKYAGVANGFMPAFILTHITGTPIDLEAFIPAGGTFSPMEMRPQMMMEPEMMMPDPFMMAPPPAPADPNRPAPKTQAQPQKLRELPLEQQVEAEKKLAYTQGLYMKGSRSGVQSYKRGVEMCREIIRDYPNTKYAEEARHLLRQVPERQRSLYKITDAELGQ
jgi:hypothetical protein